MDSSPELSSICHELCTFLAENILDEGVAVDSTTPLSNIGVDSFSLIEVILFIERKYGVVLPEDTLTPDNLANVQTLASCLHTRIGGASAKP